MFESYGIILGVLLLIVVTLVALSLGRIAAKTVREFREENHSSFSDRFPE